MDKKKTNRREVISDTLMILGGITVSVGLGMVDVAAGVIAGGVLAMVFGWLIARGGDEV